MAFLNTLTNLFFPKRQRDEHASPDHYAELEQLQAAHEWLDVKVTKTKRSYQSLILNIDIENNEILVDELYPNEALEHVETGDTIEVFTQTKKYPLHFYTRILSREMVDGSEAWRLELPPEIGANQSRASFRVYVENETDLEIELYFDNEPLNNVRIINLSSDGIKLSFNKDVERALNGKRLLDDCIIRLPNDADIDCIIELTSLYSIRTPYPHFLGGGKLTINEPQYKIKLQQYLALIQRKQRRREARED